ncbi:MAG: nitroreductase family protein [Muribaculaceae bacterium]|nr:nitroreductase family protein [Muribaculaceae bacterium]
MNIIEAMRERRSVRTFNGEGISPEQVTELERAIAESNSPFGGKLSIKLRKFNLKEGYKPSTYGMIKGAEDFFLLAIGNDEASDLSAGYRFEQVVLRAWQLGLGTCWIAATFKGSDFEKGISWPDGEELKVVCPVGVAEKPSIKEKFTRLTLGSKNRKSFNDLFFYENFKTAVPEGNPFREDLEMLRIAPSSTNSQPWRALVDGDTVHFYYKPKSQASVLDAGIGICHFHETEKYYGHEGNFSKINDAPVAPEDWRYLVSYHRTK